MLRVNLVGRFYSRRTFVLLLAVVAALLHSPYCGMSQTLFTHSFSSVNELAASLYISENTGLERHQVLVGYFPVHVGVDCQITYHYSFGETISAASLTANIWENNLNYDFRNSGLLASESGSIWASSDGANYQPIFVASTIGVNIFSDTLPSSLFGGHDLFIRFQANDTYSPSVLLQTASTPYILTITTVPEPAATTLACLGLLALVTFRSRHTRVH